MVAQRPQRYTEVRECECEPFRAVNSTIVYTGLDDLFTKRFKEGMSNSVTLAFSVDCLKYYESKSFETKSQECHVSSLAKQRGKVTLP